MARRRYDADAAIAGSHTHESAGKKHPQYKPFVPRTIFGLIGHTLIHPGSISKLGVDGIAGPGMLWQLAAVFLLAAGIAAIGRVFQGVDEMLVRFINLEALGDLMAFRVVMLVEIATLALVSVSLLLIAKVSGWWVTFRQVLTGLAFVHVLTVTVSVCCFLVLGVPGLLLNSDVLVWIAVMCGDLLGLVIMLVFLVGLFEKGYTVSWTLSILAEVMALGMLWLAVRLV